MNRLQIHKNNQNGSVPWQILIVLAVALVVPVTVFLVRQNQDIRQRAATPTVNCVPGNDADSLTRWGWQCTGSNVANRTSEYTAWQCPQNNVPSCTTHFGGVNIPLTCGNIEGGQSSALNCSVSNGALNVLLPQQQVFFNNPLPLGECGCVQTDFVVSENGTPAVAGGKIRCFPQACNMTQPPACQLVSVEKTQIPIGDTSSIAFSASDPDNNLNKMDMWYGPVPSPKNQWTEMRPNKTSTPYEMTRDFTCTPGMEGKSYYVTCNAYDSAGNACSGNPVDDSPWFKDCGPNDYVTVTCINASPSPTPRQTPRVTPRQSPRVSPRQSPRASPSPSTPLNRCTGITIACSGACTATNQFTYTCNWTKPTGATEFAIAYKESATNLWGYMTSKDNPTYWFNDKSRWSMPFPDNISRDFRLWILESSACTPHESAYGPTSTVNTIQCPTPRPSSTPLPGPRCQDIRIYKLSGPVNNLASWGDPLSAEELTAMSAEGTVGPGTQLYFTVTGNNVGNTPLIAYQKGRIRINRGTNQGGFVETTNVKPSDGNLRRIEYYVMYTVPQLSARTNFSVEGEVCAAQGDSCTWH